MEDLHAKYLNALADADKVFEGDLEYLHGAYDRILCELLTELGYEDIVKVWDSTSKWYA